MVLPVGALALLWPELSAWATSTPNDPYFAAGDQWGLAGQAGSADVPPAWCASTGAGVLVADIDTGASFGHPDLAGKLIAGQAFLNGSGQPSGSGQAAVQDDNYNPSSGEFGHGTMTTGIQVAGYNDGIGIAGVAPDAHALVVKVLDSSGRGCDNDVAAGIEYAAHYVDPTYGPTRVINLSLGPEAPVNNIPGVGGSAIPGAIQDAFNNGVAVAIAAGNNSLPVAAYSGIDRYALVVGALGPIGERAYYSATGGVNVWAPGGDDTATSGGGPDVGPYVVSDALGGSGYAAGEGTSFATPHVAGVLALLAQQHIYGGDALARVEQTARGAGGSTPMLDAGNALGSHASCSAGAGPPAGPPPPIVGVSNAGATDAGPSGGGNRAGSGSQTLPAQRGAPPAPGELPSPPGVGSPSGQSTAEASPSPATGADPGDGSGFRVELPPLVYLLAGGAVAVAGGLLLWRTAVRRT